MAVAAAYGFRYEASLDEGAADGLPSEEDVEAANLRSWTRRAEWATAKGLEWWTSRALAPIHLDRWIAGVPALGNAPEWIGHVVVMERDRLWLDPGAAISWLPPDLIADESLAEILANPTGRVQAYSEVTLSQVTTAYWLEPTGTFARFETEQEMDGEWGAIGKAKAREGAELDATVVVAAFGEHRAYEIAGVSRPTGHSNRAARRAAKRRS